MNDISKSVLGPLMRGGKIHLDDRFRKVKVDVGLSWNAPHPEMWLRRESGLAVFGFEPSGLCFRSFTENSEKMSRLHPNNVFVDPARVGDTFFPVRCALGAGQARHQDLFVTGNDPGCSSLFRPVKWNVIDVESVPLMPLSDFFGAFPWDRVGHIDQLKVDAQGSDLDVLVGAGDYLRRAVYVTVEHYTDWEYERPEDPEAIHSLLCGLGFSRIEVSGANSSYVNSSLLHLAGTVDFFTFNS